MIFQSTRSMRSASAPKLEQANIVYISIHALHAERVDYGRFDARPAILFQSTRSMRSASIFTVFMTLTRKYFNPRAPCGARLWQDLIRSPVRCYFNPRDPCGARLSGITRHFRRSAFQSTRSMRSASYYHTTYPATEGDISIHALHAERGLVFYSIWIGLLRFQSTRSMRSASFITYRLSTIS